VRRIWMPCLFVLPACGCLIPQDAYKLAGYTEPGFELKTPSGWKFSATADTQGVCKYMVHPDGTVEFQLDMASKATDVTLAQGERAAHLEKLREIEALRMVEQQKLLNDLIAKLAAMVPVPVPAN